MDNRYVDCILVNPPDDFSRYPYLGLCYLAGSLRARGISVDILDSAALGFSVKEATEYIAKRKPKIIGISVMSMRLPFSYQLIRSIQQIYRLGTIVVGGAHINADHKILSAMNITYGFQGESEVAFADFCESVLNDRMPQDIPGLIHNNGASVIAQPPTILNDLDALPMPAYDLLPLDRYYSPSTKLKTISMITSRGCPYKCIFCSKLQQTRYRYLGTDNLLQQIEILIHKHRIEWIEFVDEIFTINKKRIYALCEAIRANRIKFEWGCGTRADAIDKELIEMMHEAGCRKISFGAETGSERLRFLDNKKISNQQYKDAIELCRKFKIRPTCCFIFGHPTETVAEMHQTTRFALELKTDFVIFTKMIPIPNSDLFELAKKEGSVEHDIWTSFMLGQSPYPIYYPKGVNPKTMDRIYSMAWLRYYLSPKKVLSNLHTLLSPSFFMKSIRAFYDLVSGKKYTNKDIQN